MKLDGTAAFVSGGASGLGEATAKSLSNSGCKVTVFDRNQEQGCRVAKETGAVFLQGDVSNEKHISTAMAQARDEHGVARVIVNCAGIGDFIPVVLPEGEPHSLDDFMRAININLVGTFNCIRFGTAAMLGLDVLEGERGVVVNTSSIAAFDGLATQVAYSASKAAIAGMTLPLARDLAQHQIRVCTLAPGLFDTPLLSVLSDELRQQLAQSVPFPQRLGSPVEFAALVKHICENKMLNGEVIRLDGALRMTPA